MLRNTRALDLLKLITKLSISGQSPCWGLQRVKQHFRATYIIVKGTCPLGGRCRPPDKDSMTACAKLKGTKCLRLTMMGSQILKEYHKWGWHTTCQDVCAQPNVPRCWKRHECHRGCCTARTAFSGSNRSQFTCCGPTAWCWLWDFGGERRSWHPNPLLPVGNDRAEPGPRPICRAASWPNLVRESYGGFGTAVLNQPPVSRWRMSPPGFDNEGVFL